MVLVFLLNLKRKTSKKIPESRTQNKTPIASKVVCDDWETSKTKDDTNNIIEKNDQLSKRNQIGLT
jgi:hypothetical protein